MKKNIIIIFIILTCCMLIGCKKKMISVTLNPEGGTLPSEQITYEVEKKSTFDLPIPEKPGYRFKGWKDNEGNVYSSSIKIIENVNLYAIWEEAIYNITYNLKDDEKVFTLNDYTVDNIISDFIKDYQLFSGITVNKEKFYSTAKKPLFSDNGMFTNSTALAKWEWLLIYLQNVAPSHSKIEIGKALSGNLTTIDEKYILQELDGFLNKKQSNAYSKSKTSTNYADESILLAYIEILNELYQNNPTTYELGDSYKLNIPVKEGLYKFIGWSCGDKIIKEITSDIYGDLVLTPIWEGPYYELNYDLSGGKFTSYFEYYKQQNTEIILPVPTKTGLVFMGWFDENGERLYSIPANTTGNLNLKAKWGQGYCYVNYYDYENNLIEKVEIEKGQTAPIKTAGEYEGIELDWFNNDLIHDFNTLVTSDLNLYARWSFIDSVVREMFPEDLSQGLNLIYEYDLNGQKVEIYWETTSNFIDVYSGEVRFPSSYMEINILGEFSINGKIINHSFIIPLEPIKFESLEGKQVAFGYFANYLTNFDENDVIGTLDVLIHGFSRVTKTFAIDMSEIRGSISKITAVRQKGVRVLLCTGAYGAAAKIYSDAASTESGRQTLARNLVQKVIEFGYDGIDIDWEYPGYETGRSVEVDRANYTLLIEEIYNQLQAVNPDYLLTAAIPGGSDGYRRYELKKLNKYFDYIQLMTYDLQNTSKVTHHTPLLYNSVSTPYGSVSTTINTFLTQGISANKLVVGIAFYGRVFELTKAPSNIENLLGYTGVKKAGDHMTYSDIYKYYITKAETDPTIHILYDEIAKAPYFYDEEELIVVSYDDPDSVKAKCQYAIDNNLGGVMFWEYWEDNTGQLLQAIKDGMNKE